MTPLPPFIDPGTVALGSFQADTASSLSSLPYSLDGSLDLVVGGSLLQSDGEIDDRHVSSGHTEGHACSCGRAEQMTSMQRLASEACEREVVTYILWVKGEDA